MQFGPKLWTATIVTVVHAIGGSMLGFVNPCRVYTIISVVLYG